MKLITIALLALLVQPAPAPKPTIAEKLVRLFERRAKQAHILSHAPNAMAIHPLTERVRSVYFYKDDNRIMLIAESTWPLFDEYPLNANQTARLNRIYGRVLLKFSAQKARERKALVGELDKL